MDPKLVSLDRSGRDAAQWFVDHVRRSGWPITVVSGRRSAAQQAALIPGPQLPKASPESSRHVQGRAFDLGFIGYGWRQVPWVYWEQLGQLWESIGGRWGGRFRQRDPVHFDW